MSTKNNENSLQDAGIAIVIDENNEGWLNLIEDSETGLGNWKDYFNVIKINS